MLYQFKLKDSMMNVQEILQTEYVIACNTESDINKHLPKLHELAKECSSVVELGVRSGVSTRAFLCLDVKLRSYDLYKDETVADLFNKASSLNRDVQYIVENTLTAEIESADMMFVDTDHTYQQVSQELKLHADKIKKYIAFHDTQTYSSEVLAAIVDFMMKNREWEFHYFTRENNGLTVLKRKS
jgi:hypothetical protein